MSKLIFEVGYSSKGRYKVKVNGKHTEAYTTWYNMLRRAYCPKYQAKKPTYVGCSVSDEWLEYQEFAEWFETHAYSNRGYELDKDLLIPANKTYAPDLCVFVPRQLNSLLNDSGAMRGQYPQGVCFNKRSNKLMATICINGKNKHLGYFDTPQEAYQVYKTAKEAHVKEKALEWQDRIADNAFQALMNWKLS